MKTRRKLSRIFKVLGVVLLLCSAALFAYNQYEDRQAQIMSDNILEEFENEDDVSQSTDSLMPVKYVNEEGYIGTLSIPKLDMQLPVADNFSYAQLRNSPCRYSGSLVTDDLVIAAHNYFSHFYSLSTLSQGDSVYFTDANGITVEYSVEVVDILLPRAVEEMVNSDYDLTLFTCSRGGRSRITVRLNRT